jgi:integrase
LEYLAIWCKLATSYGNTVRLVFVANLLPPHGGFFVLARLLTDRKIKSLVPADPGKTYDKPDGLVPGLSVRVMPTGARTFVLVARYPGSNNPTRRSLGSYGELTLEQAREKARQWLALIKRGVHPGHEEERQRQAALRQQKNSFAAVAEEYIKRHVSKTRKAEVVERELRREFIDRWGDRPITDITQHDVVAITDEAVDRGAPYQAHNLLGHIRTLFNWAIGRGVYGLERSPCDRLKPKQVIGQKLARQRILNETEIKALWAATGKIGYPYGPLFRLLLVTGQRKSEVAEARWSEFDLDKSLWTIPAERMKANAAHVVPLSDEAKNILEGVPRSNKGDCLFSTTFGVKPVNGFSKAKDRLDKAMLEHLPSAPAPWVLHDIRRTMRTGLSALPVPDLVRELVIAHTKPGLHKVYDQHAYVDEKRHALDLWAVRVRDIVGPAPANVVKMARPGVSA